MLDNIEHLRLDYLIAIGGDDTLSFAKRLDSKGVRIIGIPKTMDNDVQGTEYCIGFSTAISRAKEAITRQRTTLGSHERIGIFRIFGRDAGFTALYTAYVTSGRCVIPEVEFDLDRLIEILLEDKRNNPSRYAFVIVSEGAVWQGHSVGRIWRGGRLRAQEEGRYRARARRGDSAAHRRRSHGQRSHLRSAQRRSGRVGSDRGDYLRECGRGFDPRRTSTGGSPPCATANTRMCRFPIRSLAPARSMFRRCTTLTRYRPHYAGRLGSPLLLSTVDS